MLGCKDQPFVALILPDDDEPYGWRVIIRPLSKDRSLLGNNAKPPALSNQANGTVSVAIEALHNVIRICRPGNPATHCKI
jgi:hypothetical protein